MTMKARALFLSIAFRSADARLQSRLRICCYNKCRVREDKHEDWGEPPPFWSVRSWGNYRTTKFRSFSLVYL